MNGLFLVGWQRIFGASQGTAPVPGSDAAISSRKTGFNFSSASRQSGAEVLRQREAVFLSAAVRVPGGGGMAAAARGAGARRRGRAGRAALRLHGHRGRRPGHAAARPRGKGECKEIPQREILPASDFQIHAADSTL